MNNPPPAPITPENPTGQTPPENPVDIRYQPGRKPLPPLIVWSVFMLIILRFAIDNISPHKNTAIPPTVIPTTYPVKVATPFPTPPGEGICGGSANISCPAGFICRLGPDYPDASGYCIPDSRLNPEVSKFTDELQTYEISAPADWERITHSANFIDMHFITLRAPDGSVFQSASDPARGITLTAFLAGLDQKSSTAWEGQPSKKVLSAKNVAVGTYPGVERMEKWLAADYDVLVTYFKAGNSVYEFSIQPGPVPYKDSQVYQQYYKILSSFRLLPATPTPRY